MISRQPGFLVWAACLLVFSGGCAYQIVQSGKLSDKHLAGIEARTAAARRLAFVRPLQCELLDEAQTRRVLTGILDRDFPREKSEIWQRLFYRLDALPRGYDLHEGILLLMTDQAAGFYDPISKKLYVPTKPVPVGPFVPLMEFMLQRDLVREFILSHEIIHALQDQHFDLEKMFLDREKHFDESLALHSVVEGDALLGGLIAVTGNAQAMSSDKGLGEKIRKEAQDSSQVLKNAPAVLREYLVFPYYAGLEFAQAYVEKSSWACVNGLYEVPPVSSEQILHPEKYFAGEMPVEISMEQYRAALGPTWKTLEENTLGEAFLGAIFGREAAAGWGGDRFLFAAGGDGGKDEALVWETRWDTEADAAEFAAAVRLWQERRGVKPGDGEIVQAKGRSLRLLQAPSEALARRLADLPLD